MGDHPSAEADDRRDASLNLGLAFASSSRYEVRRPQRAQIFRSLPPPDRLRSKTPRKSTENFVMREKIKLVSSAGTGYFYTTTKNKRQTPDKIKIKKYDPVVRKHVLFEEKKIK